VLVQWPLQFTLVTILNTDVLNLYYEEINHMNTPFILSGSSSKGPKKDYSLPSDTQSRMFGIFNAIAIIATTYGNGMIPEIQVFAILKVKR
jgi:hypothetical protein